MRKLFLKKKNWKKQLSFALFYAIGQKEIPGQLENVELAINVTA